MKHLYFKDVDNIPIGSNFVHEIKKAIDDSHVVLIVIGRYWTSVQNQEGEKRLFLEDDFIRLEVEYALEKKKTILPIFVNGARVPPSRELPSSIRTLIQINGVALRNDRWRIDINDFFKQLELLLYKFTSNTASSKETTAEIFTEPRDGNQYKTVKLKDGNIWMAENLRFKIKASWCYGDDPTNCEKYGRLYTW